MKILVAIEGTSDSKATLHRLTEYVQAKNGELRILHVTNSLEFAASPRVLPSYTRAVEEEEKEGRALLEPHVERLRKEGYTVDAEVASGETSETILAVAERWGADLIVLGSHGGGSVRRMLLGSVAYAVVRRAGCSVMVVREKG